MAERPGLVEAWTRALQAHARYAEALGSLTSTWLRELADLGAAVRLPRVVAVPGFDRPAPDHGPGAASTGPGPAARNPEARGTAAQRAAAPAIGPAPRPQPALLVLEAAGGHQATGAFLVENTLSRRVEQAVEAGQFADATGAVADVPVVLVPDAVDLGPGEQVVVQVTAVVPETLEGEHRGTLRVAGVPGAEMPVILRRLPG